MNGTAKKPYESLAVAIAAVAFTAIYARLAGQDANWDLRNYHIYVVHAWLNGQTFWHLAPAQVQSWLNPLPHVLQFFLIDFTPPVVAGMTMGALAGINGWLVWLLARRLQGWSVDSASRLLAVAIAVVSLSGSMFLSLVGASWAEPICSPFVLISLLVLVPGSQTEGVATTPRALLLSGFVMGVACGLKLTHVTYAVGLTAAIAFLAPATVLSRSALAYVAGGTVGFLATGGFWALGLWQAFGSPIFPYFNAIFRASMIEPTNWADARFRPPSAALAIVTYPFEWLLGRHPTNEMAFRDARFAVVAVLVPIAVCLAIYRSRLGSRDHRTGSQQRFWFVVLFFAVSYVVWLEQFGVQRFALPLELMTGVVLAVALDMILRERRKALAMFAVLAALIVPWTKPPDWGRVPYGRAWFQVSTQPTDEPVMYVLLGQEPMAYVIRFMPPADRFVRIDGNLPLRPDRYLGREAQRLILEHRGPIRTLSAAHPPDADRAALAAFGLAMAVPARCREISTTMDWFVSCDLVRLQDQSAGRE